jgi:hypothetical protein
MVQLCPLGAALAHAGCCKNGQCPNLGHSVSFGQLVDEFPKDVTLIPPCGRRISAVVEFRTAGPPRRKAKPRETVVHSDGRAAAGWQPRTAGEREPKVQLGGLKHENDQVYVLARCRLLPWFPE